ncbi:MAG: hypothetical protein KGH64_01140 [Candidatus Micrarchaeota archaeon]|nr:hypothetical protein [Candidatus Micrarchaeota archaeon]MDE1833922.1 hypothetical protein [Candidatus Micrarchaeota archaeon]MDE1859802.1 hypothetical protein [Candidatus Micrarchaeota archaeon]
MPSTTHRSPEFSKELKAIIRERLPHVDPEDSRGAAAVLWGRRKGGPLPSASVIESWLEGASIPLTRSIKELRTTLDLTAEETEKLICARETDMREHWAAKKDGNLKKLRRKIGA